MKYNKYKSKHIVHVVGDFNSRIQIKSCEEQIKSCVSSCDNQLKKADSSIRNLIDETLLEYILLMKI